MAIRYYNLRRQTLTELVSVPKVYKHTEGKLIHVAGLPAMYDYEFFPQTVRYDRLMRLCSLNLLPNYYLVASLRYINFTLQMGRLCVSTIFLNCQYRSSCSSWSRAASSRIVMRQLYIPLTPTRLCPWMQSNSGSPICRRKFMFLDLSCPPVTALKLRTGGTARTSTSRHFSGKC